MPNLREQRVSKDEMFIAATNGQTVTITRADVVAHFATETGTRAQRRQKTRAWVVEQIRAALGDDILDPAKVTADFDDVDATRPMTLEITA